MNDEFSPVESLQLALRRWWLIALAMIIGGLFGVLFSQIRQPIYETSVSFPMSIDYTRTGPITQYDEDHALGMAGTLIYSSRVQEEVVSIAQQNGIDIDYESLFQNSYLERKAHVWIVRIQNENPETTVKIADIWADVAIRRLTEAYQHALEKEKLERYASSLVDCLELSVTTNPVARPCEITNLRDLQQTMNEVQERILEEKQTSFNIFPGLLFGQVSTTGFPLQPARYGQGNLVIAGMVIGFIAGLFLVYFHERIGVLKGSK